MTNPPATAAPIKTRKKLIEVALPLDKINEASAREKSIRHGHPSTLHLWWARRPLAAARAVIFAQMVDDPSEYTDTLLQVEETRKVAERELKKRTKAWELMPATDESGAERGDPPTLAECAADIERERLFRIIEDLVRWENTTNEYVLDKARAEIWQSWRRACADNAGHPSAAELFDRNKLPAFHDPFAGGGALPLEAQRLGLESYASDLNPVPVLINKAMIEIPPRFAGQPPVNPEADCHRKWKGAEGLADDVRYYGKWMRDEAEKRIGRLYPKVKVTAEMAAERPDLKSYVGRELTVIAWLWARTVKSPNPAFRDVDVPLVSTYMLSSKAGKEAYVEPRVEGENYQFSVKVGKPVDPKRTKAGSKSSGSRSAFLCLMSGAPMSFEYLRTEGRAGRMGKRLMAIVAEADRGRVYLAPTVEHEAASASVEPGWKPDVEICHWPGRTNVVEYGLTKFGDLFTDRQLLALSTFSDLVAEAREKAEGDAAKIGLSSDTGTLDGGSSSAAAYAQAIAVYLGITASKSSRFSTSLSVWRADEGKLSRAFGRQAMPMTWDFAETNPFSDTGGDLQGLADGTADALEHFDPARPGYATQQDAATQELSYQKVVSTDPPYYDNISYADLSDYFYVWLRHSLKDIFPNLFSTVATPKSTELIASPYRQGGKEKAEAFFLSGMTLAMHRLSDQTHPAYPVTIYYAFKQSETDDVSGTTNTGWDTFLAAVIEAGLAISGTWPARTEGATRVNSRGANALASSIILVCRPRCSSAETATRREFVTALKVELPEALKHLQRGNIAPVDLAQAAIGPGMAVFTRYAAVIDGETGKPITVREALARINEVLDETLAAQEGDFDPDTRWAVTWFDQFGFEEGDFGHAEQLSKAKNTAVTEMADLKNGGIVIARGGKVKLTRAADLPEDWDPDTDPRLTVWEMVHHLIRRMDDRGETAAAALVAQLGVRAEAARELAYRLYAICERKKRSADALAYNSLVQAWPELVRLGKELAASGAAGPAQTEMAL